MLAYVAVAALVIVVLAVIYTIWRRPRPSKGTIFIGDEFLREDRKPYRVGPYMVHYLGSGEGKPHSIVTRLRAMGALEYSELHNRSEHCPINTCVNQDETHDANSTPL